MSMSWLDAKRLCGRLCLAGIEMPAYDILRRRVIACSPGKTYVGSCGINGPWNIYRIGFIILMAGCEIGDNHFQGCTIVSHIAAHRVAGMEVHAGPIQVRSSNGHCAVCEDTRAVV